MAFRRSLALGAVVSCFAPVSAVAQPLGTFKWQLQPHCNVISLAVVQIAGVFTLDGFDDQCGAATRAPATGLATPNPNGTIEFGLTIVTTPGSTPVHVAATISLATLGGTWRDSAGDTGSFVFTPGAGTGGSPRPFPSNGILPGSVGGAHVDPSQVQLRVSGVCASGSFMQGVGQSGSVSCAPEAGISGVTAGQGLQGGGTSGGITVALAKNSSGGFLFANLDGFVATGSANVGALAAAGPGVRLLWYPRKAAFRAGSIAGTQWDDANIGVVSVAMGRNTTASGAQSTAIGDGTTASGANSVALGLTTAASGTASFAVGANAEASGLASVAAGSQLVAAGNRTVVLGSYARSLLSGAFMFGDFSTASPFFALEANSFNVRAAGGYRLYSNSALTTGVTLAAGGGAWSSLSDANTKENFRDLDGDAVLSKIARIPIREWNYKTQDAAMRHVGPTAQDFHAAFGLGEDERRINTIDADGIALRAIQALEARTRALMEENARLRARLDVLEGKRP